MAKNSKNIIENVFKTLVLAIYGINNIKDEITIKANPVAGEFLNNITMYLYQSRLE